MPLRSDEPALRVGGVGQPVAGRSGQRRVAECRVSRSGDVSVVPVSTHRPMSAVARRGRFGRAVIVAAALEAALIGGLVWSGSRAPAKKAAPPRKIIAVHLERSRPPEPKAVAVPPKPVVNHRPAKPVSRPVAMPIPESVPMPMPVSSALLARTAAPAAPRVALPRAIRVPPPSAAAVTAVARETALDVYAARVRARVQANLRVPETIRLMRLSGRTEVTFELQPDGLLLWARIARTSGIGAVDRAALHTVKETEFPPFTQGMPDRDMNFDIDVHISGGEES